MEKVVEIKKEKGLIFHNSRLNSRECLKNFLLTEAPRGTYLLIDGRRLDPGNQFVPVKEGSELTLECAVDGGNPPPILAWGMTLSQATLDGPEQPPDNLTILPNTSGRHSGAHLKVLRGHHNATIICVARHVTLPTPLNASILLDVQCEFCIIYELIILNFASCIHKDAKDFHKSCREIFSVFSFTSGHFFFTANKSFAFLTFFSFLLKVDLVYHLLFLLLNYLFVLFYLRLFN